jgi:hypothetical protein
MHVVGSVRSGHAVFNCDAAIRIMLGISSSSVAVVPIVV